MARHRVRLEFDVEFTDVEAAEKYAGKVWMHSGQLDAKEGPGAEAEATVRAKAYPAMVAATVAVQAFYMGAGQFPYMRISGFEFGPPDPPQSSKSKRRT